MTQHSSSVTAELLPCPFCGGGEKFVGVGASQEHGEARSWSVVCGRCGSSCSLYCASEQDAIDAWNTRAPAQVMQWQPIGTAPKDGTQVLLYAEAWDMTWGIQIGSFQGGKWVTSEGEVEENEPGFDPEAEVDVDDGDYDFGANLGPTYWHPLPDTSTVTSTDSGANP